MILITGANGIVGRALCDRLLAEQINYKSVSRSAGQTVQWNLQKTASEGVLKQIGGITTLVHCAPIWLLPAHLKILHSIGVTRLIVFSSTSAISKQSSKDPQEQKLVSQLQESEHSLQGFCAEHQLALTVFRPAMIYGYGRDQNIMQIASFIRRYGFALVAGQARGLRQPVHVDDLVDAVLTVRNKHSTFGNVYNLAGSEELSYKEMVKRILLGLGKKPKIIHLPIPIYRFLLRFAAKLKRFSYTAEMADRMNQNLNYDNCKAHNDFNYQPQAFLQEPGRDLLIQNLATTQSEQQRKHQHGETL